MAEVSSLFPPQLHFPFIITYSGKVFAPKVSIGVELGDFIAERWSHLFLIQ
jgi:hypothetical protein